MAVDVMSGAASRRDATGAAAFVAGVPQPLFATRLPTRFPARFDVSKDGRFLMPVPIEQSGVVPITVVVNWNAGMKR